MTAAQRLKRRNARRLKRYKKKLHYWKHVYPKRYIAPKVKRANRRVKYFSAQISKLTKKKVVVKKIRLTKKPRKSKKVAKKAKKGKKSAKKSRKATKGKKSAKKTK